MAFSRVELVDFNFSNCKLDTVLFIGGEFGFGNFYKSQLQDVSFVCSEIDNMKIKNSTLKNINIRGLKVYKYNSIDGQEIANLIPINDYTTFLKETS